MASRRDIEFPAEDGTVLRGWLYEPEGGGPSPTVVMAHGFSAVKEMYLDDFAAAFADGLLRQQSLPPRVQGELRAQPARLPRLAPLNHHVW